MKWTAIGAIAVGLALATAHDGASAGQASRTWNLKPNRVDIKYVAPKSANYTALYGLLKERQALEKIRDILTPLRLPHRVLLQTHCDGMSNALSNEDGVIVCYEFLDEIWKNVPEKKARRQGSLRLMHLLVHSRMYFCTRWATSYSMF